MIETLSVRDWKDIIDLEIEFPMEVFRGQPDSEWELSSSHSRQFRGTDFEEDPTNTEFWLLREFKSRAGQYMTRVPENSDVIAWLSLMQHHGAPTRLIDFTHSFYVALFFALSGSKGDAAIWAINPQTLLDIGHSVFRLDRGFLRDEWEDKVYDATNLYLAKLLKTAAGVPHEEIETGVVSASPAVHHLRSGTQQGLFLVPLDASKSITDNLAPHVRSDQKMFRKIILNQSIRETGLAHLREMNITAESLFPGLDGFAKSLVHKKYCL